MIEVAFRHRQGEFTLDVAFTSAAHVVSLFGRSGSGKTTVLNVIAGLVRPAEARVVIAGRALTDTRAGLFVPPHRRRIGYVFQDGRLFPHLNVRRNLVYGRAFARRAAPLAPFDEIVDLLGLRALLPRGTRDLSGGERQRVAIGRALLAAPDALLMDEPLASLDEARKAEVFPYIERLRDELALPIVYVSHLRAEIDRLGGEVIEMADGRAGGAAPP